MNKENGYKVILKQKEYLKLFFANLVSRFGDSIDVIAFTWLVYQITGSASWSAIIFGINQLPSIFIQPLAGPLVERMNKRKIMVITDIIRGVSVSLIAILFLLDMLNPYLLMVITFINSSVEAFRLPAGMAILPKILDMNYYEYGSSISQTSSRIVEMIGLAAAGGIIAFFGIHTAIIIDAVTFFLSAFIISFIKYTESIKSSIEKNTYFTELKEGFIYVKSNNIIFTVCIFCVLLNAFIVPMNSLQAPLVQEVFSGNIALLSTFSFTLSFGMIIGSLLYPIIKKYLSDTILMSLGGCFLGFYYLVLIFISKLGLSNTSISIFCGIASVFLGFGISLSISALQVLFMKNTKEEYLSRAGSIFNASAISANPIMSFIISITTTVVSVTTIFIISGIITLLVFTIYTLKFIKVSKQVELNYEA